MKKLVAALLCGLLLLSAAACTAPDPEEHYEKQKDLYDDVIEDYRDLLARRQAGEELFPPETEGMAPREAAIAEALHAVADTCPSPAGMGYAFKDMDGNGTPELLLLAASSPIRAILTLSDGEPILLCHTAGAKDFWHCWWDETLLRSTEVETDAGITDTYYKARVEGDRLVYDAVFGGEWDGEGNHIRYYREADGVRTDIDAMEFQGLMEDHRTLQEVGGGQIAKWNTPRIVLALPSEGGEEIPDADFSSYEAVKSTFKAMLTDMPRRTEADWLLGNCDGLFTFASDADYDTYSHLWYLAYTCRPGTDNRFSPFPENGVEAYGYAEADLNGDGQDELVLLTDTYKILAIFTTVDGQVIPVDDFMTFCHRYSLVGMSADGELWTTRYAASGGGYEWVILEITQQGVLEERLIFGDLWTATTHEFFKVENGQRTAITEEEYDALVGSYSNPDLDKGESVRVNGGLTFNPLVTSKE